MNIPGMESSAMTNQKRKLHFFYSPGLLSYFADATLHVCLHPPTGIRINVVSSNQWEECLSY